MNKFKWSCRFICPYLASPLSGSWEGTSPCETHQPQTQSYHFAGRGLMGFGKSREERDLSLPILQGHMKPETAHLSDRKAFVRRRVKHFLRAHQPWRQAFRMMVPQESLQHLAVGREAIGPEIMAHQFARGLELFVNEWQRA